MYNIRSVRQLGGNTPRVKSMPELMLQVSKGGWESLSSQEKDYWNSNQTHRVNVKDGMIEEDLPEVSVVADRPKKKRYLYDDIGNAIEYTGTNINNGVMQTVNTTGALSGEIARGIGGKGFNLMNIIPEYLGGTGNQGAVSEELGIENLPGAIVTDSYTDPIGLISGARVASGIMGALKHTKRHMVKRLNALEDAAAHTYNWTKRSMAPLALSKGALTHESDKKRNGGNIHVAQDEHDARVGLKDNTRDKMYFPGSNNMTMRGMSTPVRYYGITRGRVTDSGVAYPGEDFKVNGESTLEYRMPRMQTGGKYTQFKQSLPSNLANTPESEYAMRRYWNSNNRPTNFDEAQSLENPMFFPQKDGYHAPSVDGKTMRFLKPKTHPTVGYEYDWYNSDDPEAVEFRGQYKMAKNPLAKFDKYIPRR